jgi:HSP20 family molecular chaperone IbpA
MININEQRFKNSLSPSIGGAILDEKNRIWEITAIVPGVNKETNQIYVEEYTLVYKGNERDVSRQRLMELANSGKIKIIR